MPRARVISLSQLQDEEVPNIESHHEYINRVLKWSISDLERFISLLRARVAAEEVYVQSLSKISRAHQPQDTDPNQHVAHMDTTYHRATLQYERSLDQLVAARRKMIQSIQQQIELLLEVKEKQENRRKKVKTILGDTNSAYISYRTRDIVKLHKSYFSRCADLQHAQHQLQQQIQQQQAQHHQQHQNLSPNSSEIDLRENDSQRLSSDEPRPRLSTDNDSISSLNDTSVKKGMASFMAQVRTQFANAAAASSVQEVSRQNAKCARLTTEISTADLEYRDGIRRLESLRRKQVDIASTCMKQVETVFKDKFEASKAVLGELVLRERNMITDETRILDFLARTVDEIDSSRDIFLFNKEYQKRGFLTPSPIYYTNYYHGEARDLIFGTSLDDYAAEHSCTVPVIVLKCIEAVERMGGLQKEGIYRVSGRQSNVDNLKSAFEQNEQGLDLNQGKYDVTTISSILKIYLRELKHPLFSLSVQNRMEYATLDRQVRLTRLQSKIALLSKIHRDTLHTLMRHLFNVNKQSQINKMNIQNLSVVFTPAIFHDHNNSGVPGEWHTDCVFEDMLLYHEPLFRNAEIENQNNSNASLAAAARSPAPAAVQSPGTPATQSPVAGNRNMLLTAPLHPSNLATGEHRQDGYNMPSRAQEVPQQQRSTSLGASPIPAAQPKYSQQQQQPQQQQQQQQQHAPHPPHYQPQLKMQPAAPQIQTPQPQPVHTPPLTQPSPQPPTAQPSSKPPHIQTEIHREPSPATPIVDTRKTSEPIAPSTATATLQQPAAAVASQPARSSSHQHPSSPVDDSRADAAAWIGMAAMSPATMSSSQPEKPPVITTTAVGSPSRDAGAGSISSPVSPIGSAKTSPAMAAAAGGGGGGGTVPPRQDSLRLQVAPQQQPPQPQQPPPIVTASPLPAASKRSRPSPTGPQTPTIAMSFTRAEHIPSSAIIIENPVPPTSAMPATTPSGTASNSSSNPNSNNPDKGGGGSSTLANSLSFGK